MNIVTDENDKQSTPAMSQYFEIKAKYQDTILFFRMGDFYEMFADDALVASKILGITLTARNKNSKNPIPLCGIPYHSYLPYLIKLLKAGKKVAICEQLEDAKLVKGVVKRGVTQIITPATVVEEDALANSDNNFLLSIYSDIMLLYIAAIDVSTGETYLKSVAADKIDDVAAGWPVREVISNTDTEIAGFNAQLRETPKNYPAILAKVLMHYGVTSEKTLNIEEKGFIRAIGMALDYLDDLILRTKLRKPVTLSDKDFLIIDSVACRTLELAESGNGDDKNTLFGILNNTCTPMGSRFLKSILLRPSRDKKIINARLDIIDYLVKDQGFLNALTGLLDGVYDIERITSRLLSGRATPRDLVCLKNSLKNIPEIDAMLLSEASVFASFKFDAQSDLVRTIEKAITDEPPVLIKDGGIIKNGYNDVVDELRNVKNNGKEMLSAIEIKERQSTGISQLKVSYNKVFGFFIEVSKSNLQKVPPYFERRQTLVGTERFVTPELKELENKILGADERLNAAEYELFLRIREYAAEKSEALRTLSRTLAELDALASLARAAIKGRYVRPVINNSGNLIIKDGRHPVVEANKSASFVPNDFNLDLGDNRLLLITGPNMSGKSTYLRSAALIAIMAHMGSFVPASYAEIGIIDRIFTRVGASDNIARGESTFMVEMVETANILSNTTKNSLIILDEIGRGTSTFDGVSIAWAVAEHILDKIGAKTLFATHYHELTKIAESGKGAKNYTADVKEWDNEIIFLRKIIPGAADKSYGIYVGKLAGLPEEVTKRAEEILNRLEKNETTDIDGKKPIKKQHIVQPILVFDDSHPVIEELKNTDTDSLTPIQALQMIHELKKKAYL